jgi:hypothetical protein
VTPRRNGGAASRAALSIFLALAAGCAGPRLALVRGANGSRDAFEARGLDPRFLKDGPGGNAALEALQVFVDPPGGSGAADLPPVLGSTRVEGGVLRFEPRFPLEPGLAYRARLLSGPWMGRVGSDSQPLEKVFVLPAPRLEPLTVVTHVFPSAARLPQNQLKFYIHFSGPMRRLEAYRRIHLLRADGSEVEAPFLEIGEELWDPSATRFTLFFDPGRVKRGLKPEEEVGPPLEEGKRYALVIDAGWLDAAGAPLRRPFRKDFDVGPPDHEPPDPAAWRITAPRAGARDPLTVAFPESLDEALLHRLLTLRGPAGQAVPGEASVGPEERTWRFDPQSPWLAGRYRLVVEKTLEDLAGNGVGKPFEVDVAGGIQNRVQPETVGLEFEVASASSSR